MLPRKSDSLFQFLNGVPCAEKNLHDDGMSDTNSSTVVKALTGTPQCSDYAIFVRTDLLWHAGHSRFFPQIKIAWLLLR